MERLQAALARASTTVLDLAVAVLFVVLSQLDVWLGPSWHGSLPANAVAMALSAALLAWRRTRPLSSVAAVMAVLSLQSVLVGSSESPISLFIVLISAYSGAAYGERFLVVAVLFGLGVLVHDLNDPLLHSFGDATYDATVVGLALVLGLASRRRSQRAVRAERALVTEQADRDRMVEAAAAAERVRIARELHDIISHGLGIMVLQAGAAEQILDREPARARTALRLVRTTGIDAIGEMSRLLGVLRGESEASRTPEPSLRDLEALVGRARDAGLPVEVEVDGEVDVPAAIDVSAYRILQEGLTNVVKHAPASATHVRVHYGPEHLVLHVVNELGGRGVVRLEGGRGLAGVRERVAVFGGTLDVGPQADGRWRLAAELPLA